MNERTAVDQVIKGDQASAAFGELLAQIPEQLGRQQGRVGVDNNAVELLQKTFGSLPVRFKTNGQGMGHAAESGNLPCDQVGKLVADAVDAQRTFFRQRGNINNGLVAQPHGNRDNAHPGALQAA